MSRYQPRKVRDIKGELMAEIEHGRFMLEGDDFAPRTERERYRIYRVKDGGAPELVATTRTRGSVGVALCKLGEEGEFLNYCVGILDGRDHKNTEGEWVGKWLVLPWVEKGEQDAVEGESGPGAA